MGIQNSLNCLAQGAGEEWQKVQLEVTKGWNWAQPGSLFINDQDDGTECPLSILLGLQNREELLIQPRFVLPFSGISAGWRNCRSWPWGRTTPCTRGVWGSTGWQAALQKKIGTSWATPLCQQYMPTIFPCGKEQQHGGPCKGGIISSQRKLYVPLYLSLVRQVYSTRANSVSQY